MSDAKGIDVSAIGQGQFNWQPWQGHIDFAMMKATEGTGFIDPEFDRNWSEAGEIGIFRFAYHYFHPELDPATQAEFFIDTVKGTGSFKSGDNMTMDYEHQYIGQPIYDAAFAAWVFAHSIANRIHDHKLVVYTYPFFAEQGFCAKLGYWPLWVADYGVPVPSSPLPWSNYSLWQYAAGGPNAPDLDLFNGDYKDLEKFCTTP